MDIETLAGLVAVIALVLANGFFVATEFAIVAARHSRLEQLRNEGVPGAGAALKIVDHLDQYIAACQFGITLASLALGWVGEPAIAHIFLGFFSGIDDATAIVSAHTLASGISFALITSMHIVLGELAPKGVALQRPEVTALWVSRPMTIFTVVFRWPVVVLNGIGNGMLRLAGLNPASGHEMVHSVEELRLLVTGSQRAGVVEASEARIVARAFSFADITANMVMTPRTEIDSIPIEASRAEVIQAVIRSGHRRIPVRDGSIDRVAGILHAHDVLSVLANGPDAPIELRSLVRPVLAVPGSKGIDDLLDEMRGSRQQVAIVLDEHGGTAGLVTLTDLLEPLVGHFLEEAVRPGDAPEPPPLARQDDGSILIDGLLRLPEWEEAIGTRLPAGDHEIADTIGGLIMARLERMPAVLDRVEIGGLLHEVVALDGRRIDRVRILKRPA